MPANYPLKRDTRVFAPAWLIDTHSHSSAHKHGSDPEKTHSKFHARFSISSSLQMNTCPKSGFFPIQDAYPGFRSCFLVKPSFPAYIIWMLLLLSPLQNASELLLYITASHRSHHSAVAWPVLWLLMGCQEASSLVCPGEGM